MKNKTDFSTALLLSALGFSLSIPLLHHTGTFSFGGFLIYLLIFSALITVSLKHKRKLGGGIITSTTGFPTLILISQVIGFTFFDHDVNGIRSIAQAAFRLNYIVAILLTVCWVFLSNRKRSMARIVIPALFFIAFILRISLVRIVQSPVVDIYEILLLGPKALIQGKNPFQNNFGGIITAPTPSGINSFITYWPMSIYLEIPFVMIFNDPRILFIVCELITAVFIYRKLADNPLDIKAGLPLLYLYFPFFPTAIARSFVDPLIILFLLLGFYFKKEGKTILSGIFFGSIVATKYLYFPPLVIFTSSFKKLKNNWKMLMVVLVTIFVSILPFLLWSNSFVEKTITNELKRQYSYSTQYGLDIWGFIWTQFQTLSPLRYWVPVGIFLYFVLVWRRRFISSELEYVVTLFILVLVFPRSLGEQYYYLFGSIIISVFMLLIHRRDRRVTRLSSMAKA